MPAVTVKACVAKVDEEHADFSAVVTVDGSWRVENGHAVTRRQAGARSNLRFVSRRNRQRKPARDLREASGCNHNRVGDGRWKIHAGRPG